jgi:AcrR family transcriptional regulator
MRKKGKNEAIYDAAMGVFAEYGYRKATMDDIAAALGMTKGNLYLYVKDKKDLYEKSVGHALLRWQGLVRDAVERESDARKQFLVMGEKALEYLARDNDLRRVLVRDPDIFPMFPVRDPYLQVNRNSVALIRSILKRGVAQGVFRRVKLDSLPEVLFSIYKMLVIRTYIAQEGTSMRRMFAETLEVVTLGIFKEPRARRGTGSK